MRGRSKSLMEYICAAIDEALPAGSLHTGREIYMLGWNRFEEAHFARQRELARRELEKNAPLLIPGSPS